MKPRRKIGELACPCCGRVQPLTEQANGFAMLVCSWCSVKLQAYGQESDALLRKKAGISTEQEKSAEPAPAGTPAPIRKPNPANPPAGSGFLAELAKALAE